MKENKKIQINMSMFLDVYELLKSLKNYELDYYTNEYCKRIENEINDKLDAIQKRNVYTQSKIATSEIEREEARQKYLDLAGIHKDFRYGKDFLKGN